MDTYIDLCQNYKLNKLIEIVCAIKLIKITRIKVVFFSGDSPEILHNKNLIFLHE